MPLVELSQEEEKEIQRFTSLSPLTPEEDAEIQQQNVDLFAFVPFASRGDQSPEERQRDALQGIGLSAGEIDEFFSFGPEAAQEADSPLRPGLGDRITQETGIRAQTEKALVGAGRFFSEVGDAVQQLSLDVGRMLGVTTDETLEKFTRMAQEEQAFWEASRIGKTTAGKFGRNIFGPGILSFAVPGAVGGRVLGTIAKGAATGAAFSQLDIVPEQELDPTALGLSEGRLSRATKGAALGGAVAAPFALAQGIPNIVKQRIVDRLKDPFGKVSHRLQQETGITQTLGQQTGSRSLLSLEATVLGGTKSGEIAIKDVNRQTRQVIKAIQKIQKRISKANIDESQAASMIEKTLDTSKNNLQKTRSFLWKQQIDEANRLSKGEKFIDTSQFKGKLQEWIAQLDVKGDLLGQRQAKQLTRILEQTDDFISVKEMQTALKLATDAQSGKTRLWTVGKLSGREQEAARQLKDTLLNTINDIPTEGVLGEAGQRLLTARSMWREMQGAIDDVDKKAIRLLFGKTVQKADEKVIDSLRKMQPSQAKFVMGLLDEQAPDVANATRRIMLEGILNAAKVKDAPANVVAYDMRKLLKDLQTGPGLKNVFPDAKDRAEITKTILSLKRIRSLAISESGQKGTMQLLSEGFRTGVSMDPIFVSGLLGSIFAPNKLSTLLFTEKGRQILQTLSNVQANKAAAFSAITAVEALNSTQTD